MSGYLRDAAPLPRIVIFQYWLAYSMIDE